METSLISSGIYFDKLTDVGKSKHKQGILLKRQSPWDSEKKKTPWVAMVAVPGGGMPGRNFTSAVPKWIDGIDGLKTEFSFQRKMENFPEENRELSWNILIFCNDVIILTIYN